MHHNVGYNNRIEVIEGVNTMNKDGYTKMVEDGRNVISILNSVPEDKRPMLSAIAGAFIDGMIAQERLMAAERDSA